MIEDMSIDEIIATIEKFYDDETLFSISAQDWIWLLLETKAKFELASINKATQAFSGEIAESELSEKEYEYLCLGKRRLGYAKENAEKTLKATRIERTPNLKFENLTYFEQSIFKKLDISTSSSIEQLVLEAEKRHNLKRDKVTIDDYVVKEVLKKEKDTKKLKASAPFLNHILGAQLKTAKRWGLTVESYEDMKFTAKSLKLINQL